MSKRKWIIGIDLNMKNPEVAYFETGTRTSGVMPMKIGNQGDWGMFPNKQNRIRCTPMHCLPICEDH